MSERKDVIKKVDISEDKQQDAMNCATQATKKYNVKKHTAAYIKKPLLLIKIDKGWNCTIFENVFWISYYGIYFYYAAKFTC
ncbi:hypothetical protein GDO78_019150 [Eleutherodactylus coqui]|uniref:Dynein light chain n=1 Tax=Eleutherodactylus coqui TaxID=57060 RepID=A0A8J6EJB6_ELECQ|nr:hypothetical protein GDO78_019150 [Eleutherodactylus coqui]